MSRIHLLTIRQNDIADNPIHSDGTFTFELKCPGVTDACRAYSECTDEACDVSKLEDLCYEQGEDSPVLHGVVHESLDYGFGVPLDYCMIQVDDGLYDVAEDFALKYKLGAGEYVVEHLWTEGRLEEFYYSQERWPTAQPVEWFDIAPKDAIDIDLTKRLDITAPLNEMGERCPWPWEPQQLAGIPLGQYRCGYCAAMCVAGVRHPDYTGFDEEASKSHEAGNPGAEWQYQLGKHKSLHGEAQPPVASDGLKEPK